MPNFAVGDSVKLLRTIEYGDDNYVFLEVGDIGEIVIIEDDDPEIVLVSFRNHREWIDIDDLEAFGDED